VKAGLHQGPAGGHRAGDLLAVQLPVSSEGDDRRVRVAPVALLERCLGFPKEGAVHGQNVPHRHTGSATVRALRYPE
jgi:hypothetical protein